MNSTNTNLGGSCTLPCRAASNYNRETAHYVDTDHVIFSFSNGTIPLKSAQATAEY
jgi:hypothetical protein